jgi:hypothetical protein
MVLGIGYGEAFVVYASFMVEHFGRDSQKAVPERAGY